MRTKSKLMAALVMLVVSAIMMSSASFAWFSISTNPEITNIKVNTVVNENLEIALASSTAVPTTTTAGDNTTWGNNVVMTMPEGALLKPTALKEGGATLQYPVYGTDGRIKEFGDLEAVAAGNGANGVYFYKIPTTGTDCWAVRVDFWLRTNVAGNITLCDATQRITGDDNTAGTGSTLSGADALICVGTGVEPTDGVYGAGTFGGTFTELTVEKETVIINGAKADAAYPVSVILYLDGTELTNADVDTAVEAVLNLQFDNVAITDKVMGRN